MSYALSQALQAAVYQRLASDAELMSVVGGSVFDAVPPGPLPSIFVTLGPERVRDASDDLGQGAWHDFEVSVICDHTGFATAKTVAGAVADALVDAPLTLSRGALIGLRFLRARARRVGSGHQRRIDLTFRARVQDD